MYLKYSVAMHWFCILNESAKQIMPKIKVALLLNKSLTKDFEVADHLVIFSAPIGTYDIYLPFADVDNESPVVTGDSADVAQTVELAPGSYWITGSVSLSGNINKWCTGYECH